MFFRFRRAFTRSKSFFASKEKTREKEREMGEVRKAFKKVPSSLSTRTEKNKKSLLRVHLSLDTRRTAFLQFFLDERDTRNNDGE
jgi:hypothetical protein